MRWNESRYEALCSGSANSLIPVLADVLGRAYTKKPIFTDNYLLIEGDVPVALVAHADTVASESPRNFLYDRMKKIVWGCGVPCADDRAGIYAILEIVMSGLRPHIIICNGEELGGIGAIALIKDYPETPFDIHYMVELDREGFAEAVYYDCENQEMKEYITSFGFDTKHGTFTDISIIAPAWYVGAVNLSVGYEHEHTGYEILHTDWLIHTIDRVCAMLREEEIPRFEYIGAARAFKYAFGNDMCDCCGEFVNKRDLIPIVDEITKEEYNICIDCLNTMSDNISWCTKCHQPFLVNQTTNDYVCEDCADDGYTAEI